MMYNEDRKLIDCCILVADSFKKAPDYDETGNSYKFSYSYGVPMDKIEEAQKFIAATFDHFGQPCSRVYISGFDILTKNSVWTKERIVEQVKSETERINMILADSQSVKTR